MGQKLRPSVTIARWGERDGIDISTLKWQIFLILVIPCYFRRAVVHKATHGEIKQKNCYAGGKNKKSNTCCPPRCHPRSSKLNCDMCVLLLNFVDILSFPAWMASITKSQDCSSSDCSRRVISVPAWKPSRKRAGTNTSRSMGEARIPHARPYWCRHSKFTWYQNELFLIDELEFILFYLISKLAKQADLMLLQFIY